MGPFMNYQHSMFLFRISVALSLYAAYDLCVTNPEASIHGDLITEVAGWGMLARASFLPQPIILPAFIFHYGFFHQKEETLKKEKKD